MIYIFVKKLFLIPIFFIFFEASIQNDQYIFSKYCNLGNINSIFCKTIYEKVRYKVLTFIKKNRVKQKIKKWSINIFNILIFIVIIILGAFLKEKIFKNIRLYK